MHTLILQHMLPCFLAIPLFWWGRGGRKATDAARQRAGPCYCCRWWKQNPFFFSHYQLSNVAKPTSASQSNISFLSSLCEVWELQYVLPAASRKLLCIVLLKWLQKCCQRDTVNCSFCVYVFFYLKKKERKKKTPKPCGVERTDFCLFYQSFLHFFGRHWVFLSAIHSASIFNIE